MSRVERVSQQLKRDISLIIQRELTDPRLEFVTITQVEVSPDLRYAKVFFSVLGSALKCEKAQEGLDGARGLIRKLVSQQIMMRHVPELTFIYDRSLEWSASIEETLREIKDAQQNHSETKEA